MNNSIISRPKSSQLTVCVKDLYRPASRQSQSVAKKTYVNSYRFKLLNIKQTSRLAKSSSPIKSPKSKSDITYFFNSDPKSDGLMIKMIQSPEPSHVSGFSEILKAITPKSVEKTTVKLNLPKHCASQTNSNENNRTIKPIFNSLQAQKLNINKVIFKKRQPIKFNVKSKLDKKIVPVPRVEYLSGWEEI